MHTHPIRYACEPTDSGLQQKGNGGEVSTPAEQGDAAAQAAADLPEVPVRGMIFYLAFHRDVTDE